MRITVAKRLALGFAGSLLITILSIVLASVYFSRLAADFDEVVNGNVDQIEKVNALIEVTQGFRVISRQIILDTAADKRNAQAERYRALKKEFYERSAALEKALINPKYPSTAAETTALK